MKLESRPQSILFIIDRLIVANVRPLFLILEKQFIKMLFSWCDTNRLREPLSLGQFKSACQGWIV